MVSFHGNACQDMQFE